MHRIDADGHVANHFSDGDQALGIPGTKVDAAFMEAVQEEICNLLVKLGVTLTKGTNTQLRGAVAPNVAKGMANVKLGATPSALKGSNVASVEYRDTNLTLRVTWTTAFPDADYALVPFFMPGGTYSAMVYDKTSTYVDIRVLDASSAWSAVNLSAFATTYAYQGRISLLAFTND